MKVTVFGAKSYDRSALGEANAERHELIFLETPLDERTVRLAEGSGAVCVFVNDVVNREVLEGLSGLGVKLVALRCSGFNNVDLPAAMELGMAVVRVPAYSPHAVAEHAVALLLALTRRVHKAYNRVRDGNFELEGLLGFDLEGKTVGVIGTGQIGAVFARIMTGFGCRVLAYDVQENPACVELGVEYVPLGTLYAQSRILSLHCPLLPQTWHLLNAEAFAQMQDGVTIINTSRGGLLDTKAAIEALKTGRIGALGLDVYEEENGLFFTDQSSAPILDDDFTRMTTFPNVIITGHQGFFTEEALHNIAATTIGNITAFEETGECGNALKV